ncbi:MAG: heme ABC transporter permease, partial [Sphingomicrobium sp.]
MHGLANPTRFLRWARPASGWLLGIGLLLAIAGMAAGLTLTPPDDLQGETVRILYIHVPA